MTGDAVYRITRHRLSRESAWLHRRITEPRITHA